MSVSNINTSLEINKRILKAFSVDALKIVFNLTHSKERQAGLINSILNSHNQTILYKIIFDNFSLLKQHVYTYEYAGVLNNNWLDNHPAFINQQPVSTNHTIFNLLVPIKYVGYNQTQNYMDDFDFLLPVQIHKKKTTLTFHINILERDISTITTDKIIGASRNLNDEKILEDIFKYAIPIHLFKFDLNKGVKKLWDIDEIEAIKVKFKKAKSTSQEVMDESNLGIKKEMPNEYAELVKTPLRHTTFRIIKQKNLVNFFIVDPTSGIFNFSVFPPNLGGINALIDLVLKHN